jgi:hypothetical protein
LQGKDSNMQGFILGTVLVENRDLVEYPDILLDGYVGFVDLLVSSSSDNNAVSLKSSKVFCIFALILKALNRNYSHAKYF